MLRSMPQHRVLVVEDEEEIASPLVHTLEREGYLVDRAATGRRAVEQATAHGHDIVILDLGLPDMDGLDVCRELRQGGYQGAVLILTARSGELDRVVGLDSGADDYLGKPFGLAELLARLRALLRRTSASGHALSGRQLLVDVEAHRVYVGDDEVPLTGKEFDVLTAAQRQSLIAHLDRMHGMPAH